MKRLPRLDLNLLQIFDAIYTKGGVSAAASHLNLSQPAISHALAKLRAMLDDPLFIRQGNRLVPTGTARAVAEPIHTALRELVAALDGAGSFDPHNRRASFVSESGWRARCRAFQRSRRACLRRHRTSA